MVDRAWVMRAFRIPSDNQVSADAEAIHNKDPCYTFKGEVNLVITAKFSENEALVNKLHNHLKYFFLCVPNTQNSRNDSMINDCK